MGYYPVTLVEYEGRSVSLHHYARLTGQNYQTVYKRWRRGAPLDARGKRGRPRKSFSAPNTYKLILKEETL